MPARGGTAVAMLLLHDLTAVKRVEQMRADFVANASHELKTPLASLIGFIETLQGPARDDRDAHERFLAIMAEQADRMSRLVRDLLSLSQIELNEHSPPDGRVDLADLARHVAHALQPPAAARAVTLTVTAAPGLPAVVGDRDQIEQISLSGCREVGLQGWTSIKVVDQGILALRGDKNDAFDARRDGFRHDVGDARPIHDRQHLLGDRLGDRKKAGAQPSNWNYCGSNAIAGHATQSTKL